MPGLPAAGLRIAHERDSLVLLLVHIDDRDVLVVKIGSLSLVLVALDGR